MLPNQPKATLNMVNKGLTPVRGQTLNETVRHRRRGWLIATWVAMAVLAVLVAAFGYALVERRDVARAVLMELLADAGFGDVRFDVEAVALNRFVATDLRIGDDAAMRIDRVTVVFRPAGLRDRRIDSIVLEGLDLTASVTEDGVTVVPFFPLPGPTVDTGDARAWRIDAIGFRAARLRITGPVAADLRADGTITLETGDRTSGHFDVQGTITPPGMASGMAPFPVAGPVAFAASGERLESMDLTLTAERLAIADGSVADATVTAVYAAGETRIDLRATRGDDRLTITAMGSGPADDPTTIDALHAEVEAAIAGVPIPGTGTVVGVDGRGVVALTADVITVVAATPLTLRVDDGGDAATVRIAPAPEPFLTLDTAADGPTVARLRLADGDVTLGDAGAEVRDVAVDAVFDAAIRVVVDRLHLAPRGLPDWTAPVVVAPVGDPGDAVVAARRISVVTDRQAIDARRIPLIVIDGLDVPLGFTVDDGLSGPLAPLLLPGGMVGGMAGEAEGLEASGGEAGGPSWHVAAVHFADARLRVTGDLPAELTVDGTLAGEAAGETTGTFRLRAMLRPPGIAPLAALGPATFTAANGTLQTAHLSLASPAGDDRTLALVADYDPAGLAARLHYAGDDDRVTIDGRLPALTTDPDGLVGADATFDLAVADLAVPGRSLRVSAAGRGTAAIDGAGLAVTASTPLTLAVTGPDDAPIRLRIEAAPTPFLILGPEPMAPARARLAIAAADASIDGNRFAIRGAEVDVGIGDGPRIDVRRAVVTPVGVAAWTAPLTLDGSADVDADTVAFRGRVATQGNRVRAAVTGQHRLDTGRGSARVRFDALDFAPGRLEPQDLRPDLADALTDVFGRVTANGTVSWRQGRPPAADFAVGVEDLSLTVFGARVSDIDATIRLSGVDPPTTPAGQEVRIARIALPTPIEDAVIRFGLDRTGRLDVDELRFRYLGGSVVARGASIDAGWSRLTATFDLEGIDMQGLLAAAGIEQITARGQIAGRIPLVASETGFAIRGAHLRAMSPGTIVYDPPGEPSLSAAGPGGDLVAKALRNFQYETLEFAIDGESGGAWSAGGVIFGHNPDVFRGQPFQFNIDISGDVEETVRGILFGHTLRDRIEERILMPRR